MKQEVFDNIYLHTRTRKLYMFLGMPLLGGSFQRPTPRTLLTEGIGTTFSDYA